MAAASSSTPFLEIRQENNQSHQITQHQSSTDASSTAAPPVLVPQKKRRNQPGTPYPDAEVIALSPKTLMATNRFVCEVCNKGFQREQNLQLHRRGHNLPWKLKQKSNKKDQQPPKRKVYLCPEPTCVHHEPSRALGDLTGIKKHFSRKHGEKKWKCDKCSKKYAVQSDWKAHSKTCGTREYRCDCGTLFSRRDSFITHRAFCDALAHESGRNPSNLNNPLGSTHNLYGTNHMMNLGLSQLQHHNNNQQAAATNSTMMLSLGSSAPPKYENSMHHHSSFGVQQQQESPQQQSLMSSSPFFNMTTTDPNQQGFQGGPLFSSNKQQLHGLMQLPDHLQGTNNNNNTSAFNLSFFPNSNSSGSNISDQFNNLSEGGNQGTTTLYTNSPVSNNPHHQVGCSDFSSLFANNSSSVQQEESMSTPHMSATALLQKASQMGSTTTTTSGGCSILRGMGDHNSSSSNGEGMRSSMENEHHHRNLRGFMMNSLANGINTNSLFGNNVFKGNHQFQSVEEPKYKKLSSQNLGVCFGGSDNKLTLDFLGVNGGMVRNSASGHGFSQREQQLQNMGTMNSSMDRKLEPTQPNQPFGSSTLQ